MLKRIVSAAGLVLLVFMLLTGAAIAEDTIESHEHYAACSNPGVCFVCGEHDINIKIEHINTTGMSGDIIYGEYIDSKYHRLYCYVCKYVFPDLILHTPEIIKAPDEHWISCTECYFQISRAEAHVSPIYTYVDNETHLVSCDVCGDIVRPHTGNCENTCIYCGAVNCGGNSGQHVVPCNVVTINNRCSVCGLFDVRFNRIIEHVNGYSYWPNSASNSVHDIICGGCSETLSSEKHVFENGECTKCWYGHSHVWIAGESTATCTQDGVIHYTCQECDMVSLEAIPKLGHEWKEKERIAPACTEAGSVTSICQRCSESAVEEIPVLNHNWKEAENIAPTCVSKGYIMTVCQNCSKTAVEEAAALGHDWYEAERVEATATEKGYIITACRNCSETTTQEIPTAAGHDWYESERVAATCTEKGYIVTACRHCAETTIQEIPVLSHAWEEKECVEPTCKDAGYTLSVCVNCGETVRTENADKVGHRWGKVEIVPATCTEKGSEKKTCTVCGTFTRKLTDPLGHEFSETGDSICARCGYEEAREENPVAPEQPQSMEAVIAAFRAENPKAKVLHVAFDRNELPLQLAGSVRFTIPLNEEAGEAFRLVQVLESGEIVEIAYEIIDGNMVFEADILGYFALIPV